MLVVGIWSLKASLVAVASFFVYVSWQGKRAYKLERPTTFLLQYAYIQIGVAIVSFAYGTGAFLAPDILGSFVGSLTIFGTIAPDMDLLTRITIVGCFLYVLFLTSLAAYAGAALMMGPKVTSHSNLIVGNVLLFFVSCFGIGLAGSWAGLFGAGWGILGVLPGLLSTVNAIIGFYGLLKKNRNAIVFYCYSTCFCMLLCV